MTNENNLLLDEIYHTARMGQAAIAAVTPKVENPQLREKIESQGDDYGRIASKSWRMLMEQGVEPKKETILEKMGVWGSVQCNTLTDRSSSHIADLMIQGSQMGITDITKAKNMLTVADVAASALAEEYIACEQKHITSMQKYL